MKAKGDISGYIIGGLDLLLEHAEYQWINKFLTLVYVRDDKGLCLIGSKLRSLEKGDLIIFPPNVNFSFCEEDLGDDYNSGIDAVVIRFNRYWLSDLLRFFPSMNRVLLTIDEIDKPLTVVGPKWMKMISIMEDFLTCDEEEQPHKVISILRCLSSMDNMFEFVDIVGEKTVLPAQRREMTERYIQANLRKKLTLDEVSRYVGLNRLYFSQLFKKTFDEGFSDYINRNRIEKACQLLLTTDMPISQIAHSCGFTTVPYFNRAFRKVTLQTPREYRRTQKGVI